MGHCTLQQDVLGLHTAKPVQALCIVDALVVVEGVRVGLICACKQYVWGLLAVWV